MLTIWCLCRGPDGQLAHLPDAGGVADQSAFVMDCLAILDQANAEFTPPTA